MLPTNRHHQYQSHKYYIDMLDEMPLEPNRQSYGIKRLKLKIVKDCEKFLQLCTVPISVLNRILPFNFDDIKDAILKNDIESLSKILDNDPRLTEDDNILMFAFNQAKEETILYLIENYPTVLDFKRRNQKGDTPFMMAIFRKFFAVVEALRPLSDVNACDFYKNTPFIAAAANGDISTIELLLNDENTNILARNFEGHSALHRACFFGEMETVDLLLHRTSLKVGETDKKGNNSLHMACLGLNIPLTRYLMKKVRNSQKLLTQNKEGKTPGQVLMDTIWTINPKITETDFQLQHLKIGTSVIVQDNR